MCVIISPKRWLCIWTFLTFRSVGKCYWGHRWRAAAPQSLPQLKHRRWVPLSSAAWLYKSCSAPKHTHVHRKKFKRTRIHSGVRLLSFLCVHSHKLQKVQTHSHMHTHTSLPEVTHSLKRPLVLGPSQSASLTSLWCFHEQCPTHCAAGKSVCYTLEVRVS